MKITAKMVKELRERTGVGMLDCKNALNEAEGDMENAIDILRKKGVAKAAKKAGRIASEGAVGSYIHAGGKIGVLVEVNAETDFVARTDDFKALVRDIAMHIAAAAPQCVSREEVNEAALNREKAIFRDQALASGKPEAIIDRIIEGKIEKYYAECVLLEQAYVKDSDKTVGELLTEKIATIGENIKIRRFSRFVLGEGLEKKEEDFAAEVAAQVSKGA